MSEEVRENSPSASPAAAEGVKRIQIYSSPTSSSSRQVTPFWKEKYEKDAKKYWDVFYRRHKDRFFKDRHYLDKEWGRHFQVPEGEKLVVLEVGCGAGNTIFPLISTYPNMFIHACDFSPRAIDLVKVGCGAGNTIFPLISTYPNMFIHACDFSPRAIGLVKAHKDFSVDKVNAFVCDLTEDNLSKVILPSSVDVVTMVFMLSAVAPEKMPSVLQNIKNVLKPSGCLLLRDYATGDLAQERLTSKEQQIDENFYVRGDGTRAYYFSTSFLKNLFTQNGFDVEEIGICNKQVENRSQELVMNRRWIQAVFTTNLLNTKKTDTTLVGLEENEQKTNHEIHGDQSSSNQANGFEIDVSETIAEMFGISRSYDELNEINPKGYTFKIKGVAKEYQHTCKSTGLILWDSARLMCNILAENPSIVSGKKVLELGCGSAGICSMVAVHSAQLVVATDGDIDALDLLKQNAISNIDPTFINNMVMKKLMWGDRDDIEAIKDLYCHDGGFEVIVGTDVTYSPPAIDPLFETAKELISVKVDEKTKPTLILCHMQRRVHEDSIILSASKAGFRLVDRWMNGMESNVGVINSWFSDACSLGSFGTSPLSILYFNCS